MLPRRASHGLQACIFLKVLAILPTRGVIMIDKIQIGVVG